MIKKSTFGCCLYCLIVIIYSNILQASQSQQSTEVDESIFEIDFSGFSAQQVNDIDTFFRQFSGYQKHIELKKDRSDLRILYYSTASAELISHNFRKTFEHLGYEVLFRTSNNSLSFRFIKLTPKSIPYQQW